MQASRRYWVVLVLALMGLGLANTADAQGPFFSFTQLDPPGSVSTEADDINAQGQIIGFFFDAAGREHGWLFQDGSFTQVDFPGASATRTVNINNSSVITGSFLDAAGVQHGLVGRADNLIRFDVPGSTSTNGEGINDVGTLVGSFTDAAGATHAPRHLHPIRFSWRPRYCSCRHQQSRRYCWALY
ncbi:MAG TPA: hypothetical protein VJW55_19060 [Candidatus Angelobacter sp.]|nr:hypothetical protein [Candidatus Angelobacter sp.]